MKRRAGLALAMAVGLGGCASSKLQRFVGQPLEVAVSRYGPPTAHETLPNGAEAFRWVLSTSRGTWAHAPTSMFLPISSAPLRQRTAASRNGPLFGGMCIYTVFARPGQGGKGWTIIGFQAPRWDCQ